ncbi:MAG: hypothetical protein ABIG39_04665 [Candidatus Micrarchaeota archaeon]
MKAQISLEAFVSFSAFLVFILAMLYLFMNLGSRADDIGEELAARSCAEATAELASYYELDGSYTYFPLGIHTAVEVGGKVHCTRGDATWASDVLVVEDYGEPV